MITNWLVRGDTHGQFTWMSNGCLDMYKPEETAIIILGDAGFNYYLNKYDDGKKAEINARGYRFYCVRGNHEARPQDTSCGYGLIYDADVRGEVYVQAEYPNIRFFKDWGEYYIGHYWVAVIGGAYSVDKWWRLARAGVQNETDWGYNNPKKTGWFPNEQLSAEEMDKAEGELQGGLFNFVFTHTCPRKWQPTDLFLGSIDQSTVDSSMENWMNILEEKITWGIWLFGHYHCDRIERPHVEQFYNDIESLDAIYHRWLEYDNGQELPWWIKKSPNFYKV